MNLDVEFVADQPRQFPSANRLARDQPRLQEGQNLVVDLVGAAWAWLPGTSPAIPAVSKFAFAW